jgi:hypothetical protein
MRTIENTDHLTELVCETIDCPKWANRCSECGDTAPGDQLLIYITVRGAHRRVHNGAFCSKFCHDWFHGLKPRKAN